MRRLPAGMEVFPTRAMNQGQPVDPRRSALDPQAAVEAAKFHRHEPPSSSDLEDEELPPSPGETKVVLLVVDPYLVHAYWDLAPGKLPYTDFQAVLRFYDTTEVMASTFDVAIDLQAQNWYAHLWSPARSYYVELGLIAEPGGFVPLARSNAVRTPRAWPVADVEEYFLQAGGEEAQVPSISAESVEDRPEAAPPQSSPPAGEVLRLVSATPPPEPPVFPRPVDAQEILQERLTELYTSRKLPARPSVEPIARTDSPKAPSGSDFTGRAERQFSPGTSSAHTTGKT
jgi:hypothetical protein